MASTVIHRSLGSFLIVSAIASFATIAYVGLLLSWWLILPMVLVIIGISVCTLQDEKLPKKPLKKESALTENASLAEKTEAENQLAHALEQFTEYAQGKISKTELELRVPKDSDAYQFLSKSQEAHFMLSSKAEIDCKPKVRKGLFAYLFIFLDWLFQSPLEDKVSEKIESPSDQENFKNTVVSLLEDADKIFRTQLKNPKDAPQTVHAVPTKEGNAIAFNKLFDRILEKTTIKRKVITVEFKAVAFYNETKKRYKYKTFKRQLAVFAANPDGKCTDYCINMWNREETINAIIQHFPRHEEFKRWLFNNFAETSFNDDAEISAWQKQCDAIRNNVSQRTDRNEAWKYTEEEQHQASNLNKQIDEKKKKLMNYDDNEKFKTFIRIYLKDRWLDDMTAAYLCVNQHRRELVVWNLPEKNQPLYSLVHPVLVSDSMRQKHHTHFFISATHASPLVEIDDYKRLREAKILENRFELSQTQESYENYMRLWITPSTR